MFVPCPFVGLHGITQNYLTGFDKSFSFWSPGVLVYNGRGTHLVTGGQKTTTPKLRQETRGFTNWSTFRSRQQSTSRGH